MSRRNREDFALGRQVGWAGSLVSGGSLAGKDVSTPSTRLLALTPARRVKTAKWIGKVVHCDLRHEPWSSWFGLRAAWSYDNPPRACWASRLPGGRLDRWRGNCFCAGGMELDALVRPLCLAAIPVLALVMYLIRSDPPEASEHAAASATLSAAVHAPAGSSSEPLGFNFEGVSHGPAASGSGSPARERVGIPELKGAAAPEAHSEPPRSPRAAISPPVSMAVDLPPADQLPPPVPKRFNPGPCGGVQVRAITMSNDPTWSFAALAPGYDSAARVRRVGDTVGGWRVQKIDWDRVWLATGTTRCAVGMHAGARAAADSEPGAGPLQSATTAAPVWHVPLVIAQGIRQRSQTEYQISKPGVGAVFKRAAELLSGLRLDPVGRERGPLGIQINSIPADSLLDRLGIESGDILISINGAPCRTLSAATAAVVHARTAGKWVARLERARELFDLEVRVSAHD